MTRGSGFNLSIVWHATKSLQTK